MCDNTKLNICRFPPLVEKDGGKSENPPWQNYRSKQDKKDLKHVAGTTDRLRISLQIEFRLIEAITEKFGGKSWGQTMRKSNIQSVDPKHFFLSQMIFYLTSASSWQITDNFIIKSNNWISIVRNQHFNDDLNRKTMRTPAQTSQPQWVENELKIELRYFLVSTTWEISTWTLTSGRLTFMASSSLL